MRIFTALLVLTCLFSILPASESHAQELREGSFRLEGLSEKEYAIYVPSEYTSEKPAGLLMVMHPRNTARWTAAAWRDTLVAFAEANQLIMVAPDGGPDGSVADPDDEQFQRALIDSMRTWYNVDSERVYLFGFSFGGRAVYTFGLQYPDIFAGYLILGPAIQVNEVSFALRGNAFEKPFFLINGSLDAPAIRFTPFVEMLQEEGAILNSLLLDGVPHTIDFDNRNQILTDAFVWLDTVGRSVTSVRDEIRTSQAGLQLSPNVLVSGVSQQLSVTHLDADSGLQGQVLTFSHPLLLAQGAQPVKVDILDIRGQTFGGGTLESGNQITVPALVSGRYFVQLHFAQGTQTLDLIVR